MPENQARLERDLYDHEHDEPRTSGGRRRRPVADWGVGDDVFDHMPRNRFSRVAEAPRERRFTSHAEAADRGAVAEPDHERAEDAAAAEAAEDRERAIAGVDEYGLGVERAEAEAAPAGEDPDDANDPYDTPPRRTVSRHEGEVPRGRVDDGRRTIVIGRPEDVPSEIAAITADRDIEDEQPPPREAAAPGERRTIRIGGRPEGSLEATRAQRRRPPRTAHERIGARPDRVAAYAVALGLLLILIAVVSAL
jgi:hypothetical protein